MAYTPVVKNLDDARRAIQKLNTKLGPNASPTLYGLTITGLTASKLIWADADKALASKNLVDLVAGIANEIDVADDGSGGIVVGIINPLIVAKGGIGVATLTDHGILLGSGTGAITPLGVASNGQIPIGSAGADPVLATITGTANQVTVSNAAGGITLSLPQDYDTGATPILAGLTIVNAITEFSTDTTLGGDSDSAVPTEKAVKAYVDAAADSEKVKIDVGATADYIGAAYNDGVLRTGSSLNYADGGNFVTITVSKMYLEAA